jgi:2-oxoglutarate dehydrogenase E1 component
LIKTTFKKLGSEICDVPSSFTIGKQASKIFDDRRKMSGGGLEINWGFAETMAYATLLSEKFPIRITGQDVRRGTFSHRHACVFDADNGKGPHTLIYNC